jgi:hypothetical protein
MTIASPCWPNDPASRLKELISCTERIFIGLLLIGIFTLRHKGKAAGSSL